MSRKFTSATIAATLMTVALVSGCGPDKAKSTTTTTTSGQIAPLVGQTSKKDEKTPTKDEKTPASKDSKTTTTTKASAPASPAKQAPAGATYENCEAARAAGVAPLKKGSPGYRDELDRDGDGIACE